ncbi:MAG: hypothetical protein COB10_02270 [Planctomycetota bacterium]|nr:MAG: hypothetical protein COB10_02270 [Planctomycetota bacterium]
MTNKKLLILSFLALIPVISAGCSAGNTYLRAIGSWKCVPNTTEVASAQTTSPLAWMRNMAAKVQEKVTSDMELTIDSSGAFVAKIQGREIAGQIEVTSIFGKGLGVRTEIGSLVKEGNVLMVDDDHMILVSSGTEIAFERCP